MDWNLFNEVPNFTKISTKSISEKGFKNIDPWAA